MQVKASVFRHQFLFAQRCQSSAGDFRGIDFVGPHGQAAASCLRQAAGEEDDITLTVRSRQKPSRHSLPQCFAGRGNEQFLRQFPLLLLIPLPGDFAHQDVEFGQRGSC